MVKGDTDDAESLFLIEEARTSKKMESPFRKRRKLSSSTLEPSFKRYFVSDQIEYKSPLIHLGKINSGISSSSDLDESIIVIHEEIHSTPSKALVACPSQNEQPASQDDSVIILSENEEESTCEFPKFNGQKLMGITLIKNEVSRLTSTSSRSRLRVKTAVQISALHQKQQLFKKMQSISIDSDDENTNSNEDSSKFKSPAATIDIDKNDIIVSDATKENKEHVDDNSHSSESATTSSATLDDISVAGMVTEDLCTPEKQPEALNTAAPKSKSPNGSVRRQKKKKTVASLIHVGAKSKLPDSNEDSSKFKSPAATIDIDKNDIIVSDATKENKEHVDDNSHSSESATPSSATLDDITVVWMATKNLRTAEKQAEALNTAAPKSKRANGLVRRKKKKKDATSLIHNDAKRKLPGISFTGKKKQQNPNWTFFVRNGFGAREIFEQQKYMFTQPTASTIGRYYTEERLVKLPGSLRIIVIDGSSIAMSYTNGKTFSEEGLKLVIDYFKLRGHTVKAFVPQYRRSIKHNLLEKLYNEGIVVFTPSRRIGNRMINSHDDRYILDYATMCDGIVVSLDQYRDLYVEEPKWKNTIENRLLVPTFVGNCVMFPEDPLGRNGPKLETFLRHYEGF